MHQINKQTDKQINERINRKVAITDLPMATVSCTSLGLSL